MPKKYILDKGAVAIKIKRMALQIAERNLHVNRIVLAGIAPNGPIICQLLKLGMQPYYTGKIEDLVIQIADKRNPTDVKMSEIPDLDGAVLIIVDDVSNSGKTTTYALKSFLDYFPSSIQTVALVNRTHKKFPVQPDYIGFELATTLEDYIDVEVENGVITGAWMM